MLLTVSFYLIKLKIKKKKNKVYYFILYLLLCVRFILAEKEEVMDHWGPDILIRA